MHDALEVASQAVACGEAPIGVVVYDADGQRLAQGWNQRRSTGNVLRHAELVALGATAEPGQPQQQGWTLVSTLEPCVMCWGACLELGIREIVFGLEAPPNGGQSRIHDKGRGVNAVGPVMRGRCRGLFADWLAAHADDAGSSFLNDPTTVPTLVEQ